MRTRSRQRSITKASVQSKNKSVSKKSTSKAKNNNSKKSISKYFKEKINQDRIEEDLEGITRFVEKGLKASKTPKNELRLLQLLRRVSGVFGSSGEFCEVDPSACLLEIRDLGFGASKSCQRLENQVEMLAGAEKRIEDILERIREGKRVKVPGNAVDKQGFVFLRICDFEGLSDLRIDMDEFLSEVNFFNELPDNDLFVEIKAKLDTLNSEMILYDSILTRIREFWKNYAKLEFLNTTMDEGRISSAYADLTHIFSLYLQLAFYSKDLHKEIKLIELLTVGTMIGLGHKKGKFSTLEQVHAHLEPLPNLKGTLLLEKITKKLISAKDLKDIESAISGRTRPKYSDMVSALDNYALHCPGDHFLDEEKARVEKVTKSISELMKPIQDPKFITELQETINKLQSLPYNMKEEIQVIRDRIRKGEDFYQKVKSIESSDLRRSFKELRTEYQALNVKLNFFEELMVAFQREEYFITNMPSIVSEEHKNLRKVLRIGKRVELFRFHRATFVKLILFNLQISAFKTRFADWQLKEGEDGTSNAVVEKFLEMEGIVSRVVKRLLKLAKRLKNKLGEKTEWEGWPGAKSPETELAELEQNYQYFKRFLPKKDRPKKKVKNKKKKKKFLEDFEAEEEGVERDAETSGKGGSKRKRRSERKDEENDEKQLREVMVKEITRNLMKNEFYDFSESESILIARSLERQVRFKLKNPKKYEKIFDKLISFLRKIRKAKYRNISVFLKSFDFKPKFLGKLASKKDKILKKIEKKLADVRLKKKKKKEIISDEDASNSLYHSKRIRKLKRFDKSLLSRNGLMGAEERVSSVSQSLTSIMMQQKSPVMLMPPIKKVKNGSRLAGVANLKKTKDKRSDFYESLEKVQLDQASTHFGRYSSKRGARRGGLYEALLTPNSRFDAQSRSYKGAQGEDMLLSRLGSAKKRLKVSNGENQNFANFGNFGQRKRPQMAEMAEYEQLGRPQTLRKVKKRESVFWKIFDGSMTVDVMGERKKRKMRNTKIYSGFGLNFIKLFSEIPDKLHLSTKLTTQQFQEYIDKVLSVDRRKEYLVLPAFLTSEAFMAVKVMLKTTQRVASMKYTTRCKLFIFPKDQIKPEWLEIINFVVIKSPQIQSFDLLCFLVAKLNITSYEVGIEPQAVPITPQTRPISFSKTDFLQHEPEIPETALDPFKDKETDTIFNWDDGMSIFDNTSRKSTISRLIDDPEYMQEYKNFGAGLDDFKDSGAQLGKRGVPPGARKRPGGGLKVSGGGNSKSRFSALRENTDILNEAGGLGGVRRGKKERIKGYGYGETAQNMNFSNFDDNPFTGDFGGFGDSLEELMGMGGTDDPDNGDNLFSDTNLFEKIDTKKIGELGREDNKKSDSESNSGGEGDDQGLLGLSASAKLGGIELDPFKGIHYNNPSNAEDYRERLYGQNGVFSESRNSKEMNSMSLEGRENGVPMVSDNVKNYLKGLDIEDILLSTLPGYTPS